MSPPTAAGDADRPPGVADLSADCSRCAGLCCVALAFARSTDFAADKAAGEPCRHLGADFSCTIHARLPEAGYRGCTVFDCFGAGQRVVQQTYGGRTWLDLPSRREEVYAVFDRVRDLHQWLWHLAQALDLGLDETLRDRIRTAALEVDELAGQAPDRLLEADLARRWAEVDRLLADAGAAVRGGHPATASRRFVPHADLVGADLAGEDLRGADLRRALLIAADLTGADLRWADLRGADLRDARLARADLSSALFLTQLQLDAAQGDADTTIPSALRRPAHWPTTG